MREALSIVESPMQVRDTYLQRFLPECRTLPRLRDSAAYREPQPFRQCYPTILDLPPRPMGQSNG